MNEQLKRRTYLLHVCRTRRSPFGEGLLPCVAAAAAIALAATMDASAASITNYYNTSSNFPGAYAIFQPAGSSQVDIWSSASNASFNVTGALIVGEDPNNNTINYGGTAVLILDGSTNYVDGTPPGPYNRVWGIYGSGTSVVSLINNAMLVVTNYGELNASGLGILSLSNSTMFVRGSGSANVGYSSTASSTNRLILYSSTLDMGSTALTVGGSGGYGEARVVNSIITNLASLSVSYGNPNGSYGLMTLSNSAIYNTGSGSYGMVVGGEAGRTGTLVLDHSSDTGNGFYNYIGYQAGTGVVSLVNGSVLSLNSATFGLGRAGGTALITVSNSLFNIGYEDVGGWTAVPAEVGGAGSVSLHSGTNIAASHIYLGAATNGTGVYTADGSSFVYSPAIVVGYGAHTTGAFTMADTAAVIITNSSKTGLLTVGGGGHGLFDKQGGTLLADNLAVGTNGVLTGAAGQLWTIKANFTNLSTNNLAFNLKGSTLEFLGGGSHTLDVAGADLGGYVDGASVAVGSVNNFALDALQLGAAADTVTLHDPNGGGGGALYLDTLLLPGNSTNLVANIHSVAGLNIYYRWDDPRSYYLNAQTYGLTGGGLLIAIPEPTTVALMAMGVCVLAAAVRRRTNCGECWSKQ